MDEAAAGKIARPNLLLDIVQVRRAAGRLHGFADHHLGAREILVVELQQPTAVARDVRRLRRLVTPLHHIFVHLLHVHGAQRVMIQDAKLPANSRQIQAISDEVGIQLKKQARELPNSLEGYNQSEWVLADYGDLLVHIFSPKAREYYDLERLWRTGENVEIPPE